jgi:hypothetical protein
MLFAIPLGVTASQTISGGPCPYAGGTTGEHIAPTPSASIEYDFILKGQSPNLIPGQEPAENLWPGESGPGLRLSRAALEKRNIMPMTTIHVCGAHEDVLQPL